MIIVSQEKRVIINFDNINLIGTDGEGKIKIRLGTGDNAHLGAYETEKRAKEVLQEVIKCYKDTNYEYENCWCLRNLVYEMPAE